MNFWLNHVEPIITDWFGCPIGHVLSPRPPFTRSRCARGSCENLRDGVPKGSKSWYAGRNGGRKGGLMVATRSLIGVHGDIVRYQNTECYLRRQTWLFLGNPGTKWGVMAGKTMWAWYSSSAMFDYRVVPHTEFCVVQCFNYAKYADNDMWVCLNMESWWVMVANIWARF